MPISPQAYKLCGERKKDGELLVFAGLPDPSWISRPLERWVKASGITKHITFIASATPMQRYNWLTVQTYIP